MSKDVIKCYICDKEDDKTDTYLNLRNNYYMCFTCINDYLTNEGLQIPDIYNIFDNIPINNKQKK